MEPTAIEKLLTGRRKRWFGISCGLVLTTAALPGVDGALAQYNELQKLQAELATRAELPVRARMLVERVQEKQEEMAQLEAALVPESALSTFKQDITRIARMAKCRLRSIHPGAASRRPFDRVVAKAGQGAKALSRNSAWEVEEQTSSVSIQGTFVGLLRFLQTLDSDTRILQLAALDLYPSPDDTDQVVLEMQIKTFNLVRGQN